MVTLFQPGMAIHSNSWGVYPLRTKQETYSDAESFKADDAMWKSRELLVVWAAGNDGNKRTEDTFGNKVRYRQIGGEAASKNVITVGATFNDRRLAKDSLRVFADVEMCVDNEEQMVYNKGIQGRVSEAADFSSQGPTAEGRLKPDVVAPGFAILSARSRARPIKYTSDDIRVGVAKSFYLTFETGTSQATPLVAGCAAVLR